MKKKTKKLVLAKETVRSLDWSGFKNVAGGETEPPYSTEFSCYERCRPNLSEGVAC